MSVKPSERLISLDAFRGITIVGMILVNNAGDWGHVFRPLLHAEWNGWTPTDLIFPFFLFIVGVAMTFSLGKLKAREVPRAEIYKKAFRRTVILFTLGVILNSFPFFHLHPFEWVSLSNFRIMGVLQRIALAYFFATIVVVEFDTKGQTAFAFGLIIFYWIIMKAVPVPGYGVGNLTEQGNLVGYIDRIIFGHHLYTPHFDPEGLLSTIPAISSVLFGVLAGHLIKSDKSNNEKAVLLFFSANIGLLLGLIVDVWFPINKHLWSSSYVLFTTGFALHFLAMCFWLIDMEGYKKWAQPFVWYGMNALAVYVLSSALAKFLYVVGAKTFINESILQPIIGYPYLASLAYPILHLLFWLWIMRVMYKNKIFIKV